MSYKKIIENIKFINNNLRNSTILINDYKSAFVTIQPNLANGKLLIFCSDGNYIKFGKKIKEGLTCLGTQSTLFTYNDNDILTIEKSSVLLDFEGVSAILAIGEECVIETAKYFATLNNITLIALPTSMAITNILSSSANVNLLGEYQKLQCNSCNYIIIDKDIYSKCRKQVLVDSYSLTISASLSLIDYKLFVCFHNLPFNKNCYALVQNALSLALNIKSFENYFEGIMIARLYLEFVRANSDVLKCGGYLNVSKVILKKEEGSTFGIASINAFYRLIPLYKLLFANPDLQLFTLKNVNNYLDELIEIGFDGNTILDKNRGFTADKINRIKRIVLLTKDNLGGQVDRLLALMPIIKDNYKYLYNNKKRLLNISGEQFKKIIVLASNLNNDINFLTALKHYGILAYIK